MNSGEEFCKNVRLCENAMYSVAFSILKNNDDAADAISETVLRAFSNINSLNNDKNFKKWILTILHNTCIEMLRKSHNTLDIDEQYDISDTTSDDAAARLSLRSAVDCLNEPYRTVTILYYYEDFSVKDIAKITNCSVYAAKKQLSRARAMLKKILNKEDFFE